MDPAPTTRRASQLANGRRAATRGSRLAFTSARVPPSFRALGYQDVRSYINTGNVIFRASSPTDPHELEATIDDALAGRFPERIRTLVRTLEAMRALVEDMDSIWARRGPRQAERDVRRSRDRQRTRA